MPDSILLRRRNLVWLLSFCLFTVLCSTHSMAISDRESQQASMAAPTDSSTSKPHEESLTSLCNSTTNATLCLSTLCSYPSNRSSASLQNLMAYVVWTVLSEVNDTYKMGQKLVHQLLQEGAGVTEEEEDDNKLAVQDCLELLDDSREGLQSSVGRLSHLNSSAPPQTLRGQVMDVRVWLSASFTDVDTCWDEVAGIAHLRAQFMGIGQTIEPLLAIALSLAQILQKDGGAATSYALPRPPSPL